VPNSEARLPLHVGTVDDECFVGNEDRDWYAYWRLLFAQIDENDIVNFETNYKGTFCHPTSVIVFIKYGEIDVISDPLCLVLVCHKLL